MLEAATSEPSYSLVSGYSIMHQTIFSYFSFIFRLCLLDQQEEYAKDPKKGHLSKIQDYSKATATTCLCDHLLVKHNVKSKAADEGSEGAPGQLKQGTLNFTASSTNKKGATSRDFVLWFARDLIPFNAIAEIASHYQ